MLLSILPVLKSTALLKVDLPHLSAHGQNHDQKAMCFLNFFIMLH